MFEFRYVLLDRDIQPAYEHVNHAHALSLMEMGRRRFLERIGLPLNSLIERDYFLVITRVVAEYKREILRGEIRITCENGLIEDKTMVLSQRIFNQRGKEAVSALVEFKFMLGATKKAVLPPEDFIKAFKGFFDLTGGRPSPA